METLLNCCDQNDKTHVGSAKERSQDQSATSLVGRFGCGRVLVLLIFLFYIVNIYN
jgi:hypothetical protein